MDRKELKQRLSSLRRMDLQSLLAEMVDEMAECGDQKLAVSFNDDGKPVAGVVLLAAPDISPFLEALEAIESGAALRTPAAQVPELSGKDLARERDNWFASNEGQKCMAALSTGTPRGLQYLRNRLECAFLAGTKIAQSITPQTAQVPAAGTEVAAQWVESRRDAYIAEHGSYDPDTGTTEYPGDGAEYVQELDEISEGIRSLSARPAAQVPEAWLRAADCAMEFAEKGNVQVYPGVACQHIKGLARMVRKLAALSGKIEGNQNG